MITAPDRPLSFVLASTEHGAMILSHLDFNEHGHGVGIETLQSGAYNRDEMNMLCHFVLMRRKSHGDGVVAIDGGANIGVVSVELGRQMTGWGSVVAIEAQERIFYCLAGNIALANVFNVRAIHGALVGRSNEETIDVPAVDYHEPANYGGLHLRSFDECSGGNGASYPVRTWQLDELTGDRCDLLKLDIEGMELEVLTAAERTLAALRPVIWAETNLCGAREVSELLTARNYTVQTRGNMSLAVPNETSKT